MSRERILPNEENCSLSELESAIQCSTSPHAHVRLVSIRGLILGHDFEELCELFQVTTRTLETWIAEFNEQGVDGLIDRPRSGRPRKISAERVEEYRALIENPNLADEHFWTGRKFHGYLIRELHEDVSYRSTIRFLHEQGYALKMPRPWPEGQDEERRAAHLEQLSGLQSDPNIDIWYLDETGIEGDPRPRRRWSKKGTRPTIPYTGSHVRMNICGMVQPHNGEFFCLEFDYMDREVFQIFLDHANELLSGRGRRQVVILDNASWHKVLSLRWGKLEPVFLPPYSPDLNPIERVWLRLKCDYFQDYIARDHKQLAERADFALNQLAANPTAVASICSAHT